MQRAYFWNFVAVLGKKALIALFLILILPEISFAQINKRELNLPNYDERILHYGFTLGLNSTRYNLVHSAQYAKTDTVLSALSPRSVGFSLGFVLNYKLADYFDVRLLPTVAFYERTVIYELKNAEDGPVSQVTESTFIELPFLASYKSQRRGNFRVYLVGGIKPGIEAGAKKKEKKETELRTNNFDLSVDYGFGVDIYYPLFKWSPEIRFSHGILNMLNDDPNVYSRSLNRLTTHTVSLYLHFE